MFLCKYHKNKFEISKQDAKIRIFTIPIAYWSGFRILKQNQENLDEIRVVGQFVLAYSSTQESHQFVKIFLGKYVEIVFSVVLGIFL